MRRRVTVRPVSPSSMHPKTLRILFYLALHPGLIVVAMVGSMVLASIGDRSEVWALDVILSSGMCCVIPFWSVVGFYPAWIIARYCCVPFVRVLRCPRCDFECEAVGIWSSGGYNDHREHHVLLFRNPLDGSRIGHKNCELCESTILIQERWPLEQWWLP